MLIKKGFIVHSWKNGKWVINSPEGKNFLINEASFKLFCILENNQTIEEAYIDFKKTFLSSITFETFIEHISATLGGFGILKDDFKIFRPSMKNQYLKIKIQLMNATLAGILSKPILKFYNPRFFWYALLLLVSFIAYVIFNNKQKDTPDANQMAIIIGLFYLSMPIHELGHIAACKSFNIKHGGIGFGFYFLLPVMYADVSNVWTADKEKRIIINMGGIFSELLYSSVLLVLYLVTKDGIYYIAGASLAIMVIWELNPFVRFDGYWILSDLTETPNLIKKSKNMVIEFFERFRKSKRLFISRTEVWLFIYGILNTIFFIAFMLFTIYSYRVYIIKFPWLIVETLNKLISGQWMTINIDRQFLFILTFYTLFIRFCLQNLSKISLSWLKRVGFLER